MVLQHIMRIRLSYLETGRMGYETVFMTESGWVHDIREKDVQFVKEVCKIVDNLWLNLQKRVEISNLLW